MMRAVATSALRAGGASAHSLSDPKYVERMYKEVPEELGGTPTARSAMKASCYHRIDFKIDEDASVFEAVQRFAAYNIGCLCVTTNGRVTGVISERDYVNKIALLGRKSQETRVKEIATMGANLVVASVNDDISILMNRMLARDIRHLPIADEEGEIIGMLSIKDIVKEITSRQLEVIQKLAQFNVGQGAFFSD